MRVYQSFIGILDSWIFKSLIGYEPSSVWAMAQPSPKIFSFEHGQGEKLKKKK